MEGLEEMSNCPELPQLYIKGEFIGGCDTLQEMFKNDTLQGLFKSKGINTNSTINNTNNLLI